ncbi:MAG: hypothetical protein ACOCVF_00625 [bacterium]
MKIQLGEHKNINSVNVDNFKVLNLNNKIKNFEDYELNLFANSTEIFEQEFDNSEEYRLYGSLEYLSILNGLEIKNNDYIKEDLFKPFHNINDDTKRYKNIFNSFDIYVVAPTNHNLKIDKNIYLRQFEVLGEMGDFVIQNVGYDNNIFGDKGYYYQTNENINLKYFDDEDEIIKLKYESYIKDSTFTYDYPITELFLYFKYKPLEFEDVLFTNWDVDYPSPTKQTLSGNTLNMGDTVYGDVVQINPSDFSKEVIKKQMYYIDMPVESTTLRHKYNPFMPIQIKSFGNELYKANKKNTAYLEVDRIPEYAFKIDYNENYVWRELNDTSVYVNENNVVNRPFINNRKYIFNNIILSIIPDISHAGTKELFNNIIIPDEDKFDFINNQPTNDINKLGKSC